MPGRGATGPSLIQTKANPNLLRRVELYSGARDRLVFSGNNAVYF